LYTEWENHRFSPVAQVAPTEKARRDFQHALKDEKEYYRLFLVFLLIRLSNNRWAPLAEPFCVPLHAYSPERKSKIILISEKKVLPHGTTV